MITLTKEVSKKVNHPSQTKDGKPVIVTRKATITLNAVDPKDENYLEDALTICGGDASLLARVINNGLWRVIQQWETNKLGKTDEVSKGLEKAIAGFVAMGMDATSARTMILANPDLSAKLANQKFEQFVNVNVEDFAQYQLADPDDKGVRKSRYPDITDVADEEPEAEAVQA